MPARRLEQLENLAQVALVDVKVGDQAVGIELNVLRLRCAGDA